MSCSLVAEDKKQGKTKTNHKVLLESVKLLQLVQLLVIMNFPWHWSLTVKFKIALILVSANSESL